MINQRLFERYQIDTNKNLQIPKVCGRPFDTMLIDKLGSCYACECTAWLPQSVGNIQIQSLDEILQSKYRKHLQDSVSDQSYRYCNQGQCSYLKEYHEGAETREYIPQEQQTFTIRLAIDDSCNLQCPSCRVSRIFVSKGPTLSRKKKWVNNIVDWIDRQTKNIKIVIGSDGDPFASLVYRYFMTQAEKHKWSHVTYDFQTNGMLVSKMYQRYRWIFDRTEVLNISVDGSTTEVYEKLRRGGSFNQLKQNFKFLKDIERNFKIHLHMVVQQDNWKQMPNILAMLDTYGFEKAYFNLIQDWSTYIDIKEQTKFTSEPQYQDMKKMLFKDQRAMIDQLS